MRSIFTITDDEKENNYYFKAENDYNSLEFIIKRVASEDFVVSNSFCANCQNAAEKYLKHIIRKRLRVPVRIAMSYLFNLLSSDWFNSCMSTIKRMT